MKDEDLTILANEIINEIKDSINNKSDQLNTVDFIALNCVIIKKFLKVLIKVMIEKIGKGQARLCYEKIIEDTFKLLNTEH